MNNLPNDSDNDPNLDNDDNDPNLDNEEDSNDDLNLNLYNDYNDYNDPNIENYDDYDNDDYSNKRFKISSNKFTKIKVLVKCTNKLCDHKKYSDNWFESNQISIKNINNLDDLIILSTYYHCNMRRHYNGIDLKILFEIKPHLEELNKMIGLNNIKEEIVNLIIHLLLISNSNNKNNLNNKNSNNSINHTKLTNNDMLHSVVTGNPGCGKTTFIEILAQIFTGLGVLQKGHIVKVKRSDLIGKYLGHTAVQTQKKIDEAKGGILLIDEAYSLGNPEQRDSFSKECLDTLNQALSENKGDFICIIAGYANALDSSFFSYNEGLRRRFPFRFDIEPYNHDELGMILNKKIIDHIEWQIKFSLQDLLKVVKDNFKYFINQGGDMETLFLNIRIVHNKRVFLMSVEEKNKLSLEDIKEAVKKFIKLKGSVFNKDKIPEHLSHLYV